MGSQRRSPAPQETQWREISYRSDEIVRDRTSYGADKIIGMQPGAADRRLVERLTGGSQCGGLLPSTLATVLPTVPDS